MSDARYPSYSIWTGVQGHRRIGPGGREETPWGYPAPRLPDFEREWIHAGLLLGIAIVLMGSPLQ